MLPPAGFVTKRFCGRSVCQMARGRFAAYRLVERSSVPSGLPEEPTARDQEVRTRLRLTRGSGFAHDFSSAYNTRRTPIQHPPHHITRNNNTIRTGKVLSTLRPAAVALT